MDPRYLQIASISVPHMSRSAGRDTILLFVGKKVVIVCWLQCVALGMILEGQNFGKIRDL